MLQLHLSDQQFYCLLRCVLYFMVFFIVVLWALGQNWHWDNRAILVLGKYWQWGNTGAGAILVLGQYWHWGNTGVGAILALGQYWHWGNTGAGAILALGQYKNWGSVIIPTSQIPQCIEELSHNAPICNKKLNGGIWNWYTVGFFASSLMIITMKYMGKIGYLRTEIKRNKTLMICIILEM